MKKVISILLACAILLSVSVTGYAAVTPAERSVAFLPIDGDNTLIENWDGYWTYEDNMAQTGKYFEYDITKVLYKEGNVIRVEYYDGSTVDYTYGEFESYIEEWDETITEIGYADAENNRLDLSYDSTQYAQHWTRLGKTYYFTLSVGTKSCQVPVNIVESPLASMVFDPADAVEVNENEGGYMLWDYTYGDEYSTPFYNYPEHDVIAKEGNRFLLAYNDGTADTLTATANEWGWVTFVNGKGEEANVMIQSDQQANPWYPGGENYVTVRYLGKELQVPVTVKAMASRWYQDTMDNKWYYFENGKGATGWKKVGSVWYYFDELGQMQTGWTKVKNTWYYMSGSGAMQTGWKKLGGKWYFLKSSGAMQTGWYKENGKWYFLGSDGAMRTGWAQTGGRWYYLGTNGVMRTGWQKLSGKWYYLESDGRMITGLYRINGKLYRFDNSGVCLNP